MSYLKNPQLLIEKVMADYHKKGFIYISFNYDSLFYNGTDVDISLLGMLQYAKTLGLEICCKSSEYSEAYMRVNCGNVMLETTKHPQSDFDISLHLDHKSGLSQTYNDLIRILKRVVKYRKDEASGL